MSFKCKYCNKDYKSASSRCNHIKKFHKTKCGTVLTTTQKKFVENNKVTIKNNIDIIKNIQETDKESNSKTCKFCNKTFCDRFYRWKHQKKCSIKEENNKKQEILDLVDKKIKDNLINEIINIQTEEINKLQKSQNLYMKKQSRVNYPGENVIYIVTTNDNKNKRIYIIGKAKILKNRLSGYNKTAEHEVIYYKSCTNYEEMNVVESMVLLKLSKYKEQANRDRFILPVEKDISLFINTINDSISFFNLDKNKKEIEI
jgi:hypothetical protein